MLNEQGIVSENIVVKRKKGRPVSVDLVSLFIEQQLLADNVRLLNAESNQLYVWNDSFWEKISDDIYKINAISFLRKNSQGKMPHAQKIAKCISLLKKVLYDNNRFLNEYENKIDSTIIIPGKKYYLKIENNQIDRILPDKNLQFTANFNVDDCPDESLSNSEEYAQSKFKSFIEYALPNEMTRKTVQKYVGYSLTNSLELKTNQVWVNDCDTKDMLLQLIDILHSNGGLYSADQHPQHRLALVPNCTLLIIHHLAKSKFDKNEILSLMNGNVLLCKLLYGKVISFKNSAKIIFSEHRLPNLTNETQSFWQELQFVAFTKNTADITYGENIAKLNKIKDNEMHLVIRWAIEGLLDLQRDKVITESDEMQFLKSRMIHRFKPKNKLNDWWVESKAYVTDGSIANSTYFTKKSEIYQSYLEWVYRNRAVDISSTAFFNQLEELVQSLNCNLILKRVRYPLDVNQHRSINIKIPK